MYEYFVPNWSRCYSSGAEAERDLVSFKWHGPGWYDTNTGPILVMAREGQFEFHFYNANSTVQALKEEFKRIGSILSYHRL